MSVSTFHPSSIDIQLRPRRSTHSVTRTFRTGTAGNDRTAGKRIAEYVALLLAVGLAVAVICLAGSMIYWVASQLGSWHLNDFMNGTAGFRV